MKSTSGFIELVLIIAFLAGALPLIVQLMNIANFNEYKYMEDKSVVKMNSYIDYRLIDTNGDGVADMEVPEKYGSFTIEPAAAILISIVNDDFCPETGRLIDYRFNGTGTEGFGLIKASDIPASAHRSYSLNITDGWVSKRVNAQRSVINEVQDDARAYYDSESKLYLAWDPELDRWVIQDNYVYIWEME